MSSPSYGIGGYGSGGQAPGIIPSLGYYLSLITSEYQQAPNFMQWVTVLLQPFIDAGMLFGMMVNDFSIDAAIGPQLDVLGQIVGASRTVPFQPSGGVSPVLTDSVYRLLLRAKIAQNQFNGQVDSLYALWAQLFPGGKLIVIDNQNMSCTIILTGVFSSIVQDLVVNGLIVPRPEAVQFNYIFGTLPAFGFDSAGAYIQGFDTGHWNG